MIMTDFYKGVELSNCLTSYVLQLRSYIIVLYKRYHEH